MKLRQWGAIALIFGLAGCMSPVADPEPQITPPEAYTADPVPARDAVAPNGTWHVRTLVTGLSAWTAYVSEAPPTGHWQAKWTPVDEGGYVLMSGVAVETVTSQGTVHVEPKFGLARPNEAGSRESVVWNSFDEEGSRLVLFAVQAIEGSGELELTVEWGPGEVREWRPTIENPDAASTVDRFQLESGVPFEEQIDMNGYDGIHVALPCEDEIVEDESLYVSLGAEEPRRYEADGTSNGQTSKGWTTYASIWTHDGTTLPLRLSYEGPRSPEVVVIRTTSGFAASVQEAAGVDLLLLASNTWCQRT